MKNWRGATRARRRFAAWLVAVATWATSILVADVVPWKLVAVLALVVLLAACLHALTIAICLRLVKSIVQSLSLRPLEHRGAIVVALVGMGVWYVVSVRADGLARQAAVVAAYLLGLAVYFGRSELGREVRSHLARLGPR